MINLAAQQTVGEIGAAAGPLSEVQSQRFTRYWFVSRSLMLLWLLLSLWQIGAFPLAEGDDEAAGVLLGFRLASAFDEPSTFWSPFVQGRPLFSYLPSVLGAHLLPVNEFTLRLPYALVGALQMPLLLLITSRIFGKRAAAIAGLMLLGSGLFAINRLALGTGAFMAFELAGALFLLRYIESGQKRWIVFASAALAAATLTYLDGAILLAAALSIAWWRFRSRRDLGLAVLAGPGMLIGFLVISAITGLIFANWQSAPSDFADGGLVGRLFSRSGTIGFSLGDIADTWIVYVGVPVVSLTLIGLVEAVVHNRVARVPMLILLILAGAQIVPWLFLEPRLEHPVFAAPLILVVAAFGWTELLKQLRSPATQGMVAMAIAAVALGGVAWNQAVFNPESEFSTEMQPLREYALSLHHGHGLFDEDSTGIRAISNVLRVETDPGARVFVSEGVSAAAIELYSARDTEELNLDSFAEGGLELDGAYLVIKGEDESFNAGLSGSTNVVANHRVFEDGEALYQLIQFSASGEPFKTPIWWRADVAAGRLFRENTHYTDFLTPLNREGSGGS